MRASPYGYDSPGDFTNTTVYQEIAPRNLDCETIVASGSITTPILLMNSRNITVVHEDGHHIFDFNSRIRTDRIDTDSLHLGGEPFDPSSFNQHELISETEDTVVIDGKLQIGEALLSYDSNTLESDRKIKAPNLILGDHKISDHIEF